MTADVVIAGAGLAGCTAATLYARAGGRVLLVEGHEDPATYKRACTHFIWSSAKPTMQRLGVDRRIEAAGGVPSTVDFWTPYGWIDDDRAGDPTGRTGYNIRRSVLDPMMRTLAAETPGVTLLLGHKVVGVVKEAGRVVGVRARTRDGAEVELRGSLVVGADGRDSAVAKHADITAKQTPHGRVGYMAQFEGVRRDTSSSAQMWVDGVGVTYLFATDSDITLLTCLRPKSELDTIKADPERFIRNAYDDLPRPPDLSNARRVSDVIGVVNYPGYTRPPATPGLALIGDAAMSIDYMWGVGCGWAMQTAEWLVDATASSLVDITGVDQGTTAYARRHRHTLGPHYAMMANYATGRPFNAAERALYASATVDDTLARVFGEIGARTTSPLTLLRPDIMARMVVGKRRAGHLG
jgi:2-polyprenyl-6-methoxyphenol hydroxylase-like FAD-dependent oxidoreductase